MVRAGCTHPDERRVRLAIGGVRQCQHAPEARFQNFTERVDLPPPPVIVTVATAFLRFFFFKALFRLFENFSETLPLPGLTLTDLSLYFFLPSLTVAATRQLVSTHAYLTASLPFFGFASFFSVGFGNVVAGGAGGAGTGVYCSTTLIVAEPRLDSLPARSRP